MNKALFNKILQNKIFRYVVITFIIAIIIIVLSIIFNGNGKTTSTDYVTNLENKLESELKDIKGVGKVSVLITVSSYNEQEIAVKVSTTSSNGITETITEPVLVGGEPIVLKEYPPKITGVLIICDGADDIRTLYQIQSLTVTLLDVNVNDIEILKRK